MITNPEAQEMRERLAELESLTIEERMRASYVIAFEDVPRLLEEREQLRDVLRGIVLIATPRQWDDLDWRYVLGEVRRALRSCVSRSRRANTDIKDLREGT